MKKHLQLLITGITIAVLFNCTPTQNINYQQISVPEEGGINFTQYTQEDDNVVEPFIGKNPETGMIQWYAAPFIAISPNGEKLAYVARSNDFHNLYIKKIAGGRATVQRTFNRNVFDMNFSPDGSNIVFSEQRNGNMSVFMIKSDEGAAVQQITTSNYNELGPFFAPDGNSIFYTKQEGSRYYIWNVNLESSLNTQYSEGFTPIVTPDGENLIVTRNSKEGSRGEIWMINLRKGTETILLSDPETGFSSPTISPDGETIVVVGTTPKSSTRPQNLDLYPFKIDGTNLKQLTFHGGNDLSPQWSPDGKSIFFLGQRGNSDGKFNVWRMNF